MSPDRVAWNPEFPDVFILAGESAVKKHPDYRAAKTGDAQAAVRLVSELARDDAIEALGRRLHALDPIVASVHAQEKDGINEIPEALAVRIAEQLGFRSDAGLVQTNVVNHTWSITRAPTGSVAWRGRPCLQVMSLKTPRT